MNLPWSSSSNFPISESLACCCDATCFLTLPVPPGSSPYADEATAQGVLDDPLQVADCIGFYDTGSGAPDSFGTSFGSNTITFAIAFSGATGGATFWAALTLAATGTLTFTPVSWSGVVVDIYDADGALVESLNTAMMGGPATSSSLPAGNYTCSVTPATGPPDTPPSSGGATITSSATITPCPIRAAYDDGSDTSYLICA